MSKYDLSFLSHFEYRIFLAPRSKPSAASPIAVPDPAHSSDSREMHLGRSHHRAVALKPGYRMVFHYWIDHRVECDSGQNYLHALGDENTDRLASRSTIDQCLPRQSDKAKVRYHLQSKFLASWLSEILETGYGRLYELVQVGTKR